MQRNATSGHNQDQQQQPVLPSYAEAIRTAPPPNNFQYGGNVDADVTRQPTAPVYGVSGPTIQPSYPTPSNYNQMIFPPTVAASYPPTYVTNAYPQYGPNSDESGLPPTTIHIIRPVSTGPTTCCSGRSGRILAIVLGIVILGTIFRVTMNSYF